MKRRQANDFTGLTAAILAGNGDPAKGREMTDQFMKSKGLRTATEREWLRGTTLAQRVRQGYQIPVTQPEASDGNAEAAAEAFMNDSAAELAELRERDLALVRTIEKKDIEILTLRQDRAKLLDEINNLRLQLRDISRGG